MTRADALDVTSFLEICFASVEMGRLQDSDTDAGKTDSEVPKNKGKKDPGSGAASSTPQGEFHDVAIKLGDISFRRTRLDGMANVRQGVVSFLAMSSEARACNIRTKLF
jgi:hypothetical protein